MNKKRTIILASLLAVVAISSVSLTLAWYANSDNLNINTIEVQIEGDRELLISTSGEEGTFKEELSYDELQQVPVFVPTSTMYSSEWLKTKREKPIFYDASNSLVSTDGIPFLREMDFGFYSQELYLYSDDDVYVTVDALNTSIAENALFNNAYAQEIKNDYPDLTVEEIVDRLNNIVKSMRYSILIPDEECYQYVIIDPNHNEEEVYMGGILDNNISRCYDSYFKNNNLFEVIYGEIENRELAVYDEALDEDSELIGEPSAFNAKHERGVKRFNREKSLENGMKIAKENALYLSDLAEDESLFYFPVYEYQPRKIVLSMYIEGWDFDSINSTMGANFLAKLQFKIFREM